MKNNKLCEIPRDSEGLWWNFIPEVGANLNVNNPDGKSHEGWGARNLPGVMSCICGAHPLTDHPVIIRNVYDLNGVSIPAKTLVSGMPRSGSTVVWQTIRLLTKGSVIKTHGFNDSCPIFFKYENVICTVRHPYDVWYSSIRMREGLRPTGEWMNHTINELRKFIKLKNLQESLSCYPHMKVHFLKYEDWWDDERGRLAELANMLGVNISKEIADDIITSTSRDVNFSRSQEDSLDQTLESGILSHHVGERRGAPGQGSALPPSLKRQIYDQHKDIFRIFNYEA